ncbi:hypothetical protein KP509_10G038900 [Ceratopteris richardii]|uniref:Uncharacterized protein n=1 Tax=Ceratopteris richardii TaxID=49495 RepID=A0A8T2TUI1_CERRI|nr:hypothetical protein KP509_10G038900 [Ceratopteris richardii]
MIYVSLCCRFGSLCILCTAWSSFCSHLSKDVCWPGFNLQQNVISFSTHMNSKLS